MTTKEQVVELAQKIHACLEDIEPDLALSALATLLVNYSRWDRTARANILSFLTNTEKQIMKGWLG